jgi:hypothetical protein
MAVTRVKRERFTQEGRKPRAMSMLAAGVPIPAHPLALTSTGRLDEKRQRALSRYYLASGVGGLAVAVHTTQFEIRSPQVGLFRPVLELAMEQIRACDRPVAAIGGVCGTSGQATQEALLLRDLGYDAALLSLAALRSSNDDALIEHCREVGRIIPLIGFYLQPSVGGRALSYAFWRRFVEIPEVVAIKIAPFNRYQTLDVVRAVAESGRDDIALYTGNDDNIVIDLLSTYRINVDGKLIEKRIVGGLLGHWSVWTRSAVEIFNRCRQIADAHLPIPPDLLRLANEVTDANAAFFDAANGFRGCISGLHEVLWRQKLLTDKRCLDPDETLGPGQLQEIDRVCRSYPHLSDDAFIEEHRDQWLRA